jgi:hypothetical protein
VIDVLGQRYAGRPGGKRERADERIRRIAVPVGLRIVHGIDQIAVECLPDHTRQRLPTPSCEGHGGAMLAPGEVYLGALLGGPHDVTS